VAFSGGLGDDRLRADADDVRTTYPDEALRRRGPASETASVEDRANDGEDGERDDYGIDVENVLVRFVRAVVVGSAADNRIVLKAKGVALGGRGDDVLVGGTRLVGGQGRDVLTGSHDTLRIVADDGRRDHVRCHVRRTVAYVDARHRRRTLPCGRPPSARGRGG
jgi:hypothetical protein